MVESVSGMLHLLQIMKCIVFDVDGWVLVRSNFDRLWNFWSDTK